LALPKTKRQERQILVCVCFYVRGKVERGVREKWERVKCIKAKWDTDAKLMMGRTNEVRLRNKQRKEKSKKTKDKTIPTSEYPTAPTSTRRPICESHSLASQVRYVACTLF
jgi:hypothetical protein